MQWILCFSAVVVVGPLAGYPAAVLVALLIGVVLEWIKRPFDESPTWLRVSLVLLALVVMGIASGIGRGIREGRITIGKDTVASSTAPEQAKIPPGFRLIEGEIDEIPGYTWLNVKNRVQIEVPSNWTVGSEQHNEGIKQWGEALSSLVGQHKAALSVQSYPMPSRDALNNSLGDNSARFDG